MFVPPHITVFTAGMATLADSCIPPIMPAVLSGSVGGRLY